MTILTRRYLIFGDYGEEYVFAIVGERIKVVCKSLEIEGFICKGGGLDEGDELVLTARDFEEMRLRASEWYVDCMKNGERFIEDLKAEQLGIERKLN